jgi:small GTP-binding protein
MAVLTFSLISGVPRIERPRLKVVLVGNSGVGKTCLIASFLKKPFDPAGLSTVSPAYIFQEVTRDDGLTVCLQIWDTAGQERYRSVSQLFFREADVAFVCFEAGSDESIDTAPDWVELVKKEVPDCEIIFVATKSDLLPERDRAKVIANADGRLSEFKPRGCHLTSAVSRDGVDDLFRAAAELFVSKQKAKRQSKDSGSTKQNDKADCC